MDRDGDFNPNGSALALHKLQPGIQQQSSADFRPRIPSVRVGPGVA
jgi:hypothetical protein